MHIQIISYKAIEHEDLCLAYQNGHIAVLGNLGIKSISSIKEEWMSNPNMYFSLIYLNNKIVGGVRLQIKDVERSLPIEAAIDFLDQNILGEVNKRSTQLTGEACGLWIGNEVRNMKMGLVLTRNAVIMAKLLSLKSIFALTSQYTLKTTNILGFNPLINIGNNGTFVYPTPDYISTVCANDDLLNLSQTDPKQKNIINHLVLNPTSQLIEATDKGPISIEYNFLAILS